MDNEFLKNLANTIRVISAEAVEKANSGHPGMPMGMADVAAVLWSKYLEFDCKNPDWANRDRFVLSAGHGSMLLYSLLHLFGFQLSLDQIKNFRQWDSLTPGHPEFGLTPGVDTTTGPLGQGIANGVGLALSGKLLAQRYGANAYNYRVFGICSDGDMMEGVASEAASVAGHLGLGNLNFIYDDNHISIGGSTSVCFTEDVAKRFEAYGWHVQSIDGHDYAAIDKALAAAVAETSKPSLICARTTIAKGSPNKKGTADSHGSPLGKDELKLVKEGLGWPTDKDFYIPDQVKSECAKLSEEKSKRAANWKAAIQTREVPAALHDELLSTLSKIGKDATRNISGQAIQIISKHMPSFIGGSADLEPSNKTLVKGSSDVKAADFSGKNIRYGVREHAMGAIANGLAYTRSWIPYTATFLVFSDYMRPAIRLAALSHLQTLFIFTHDSFWVGEDGPTHEPIEHIQSLRMIPNLYVFRPADGKETAVAYECALKLQNRPSALLFTRQNLPPVDCEVEWKAENCAKGGYYVRGPANAELTIVATGSEVWLAVDAQKNLASAGIKAKVVSMPCVELFRQQSESYRNQLIPPGVKTVVIEAGTTFGWERVVGANALLIGIDHFGASAPGEVLAEKFGFTPEAVVSKIKTWLAK